MKILNILPIVLVISLATVVLAENVNTADVENSKDTAIDNNATFVEDANDSFVEDANTTTWDEESSTQDSGYIETKKLSEFEKLFVNHTAFNFYKTGILSLYQGDYKSAYENAMSAKDIVDNTELNATTIALPFMPSFVRESAYSPKRTFYKIVKQKEYKLKRLVTKAKLISPPIASVVIHRTSTTIDIILRNHGDLPFDEFEVLVNEEPIAMYEKLLPNEEKTIKIQSAPKLYEVSFKEKYGFAPKSFMLSEEY